MKNKILFILFLCSLSNISFSSEKLENYNFKEIYYAKKEIPDNFKYKVYLVFIDDSHFTLWKTSEDDLATVTSRIPFYFDPKNYPGTKDYVIFRKKGKKIFGQRSFVYKNRPYIRDHTTINKYSGLLTNKGMNMKFDQWSEYPDGTKSEVITTKWNFVKVKINP